MRSILKTVKTAIYNFLHSKIQITVIIPPPTGVEPTSTPKKIICNDSPLIKKSKKSNFRFVEEIKKDCFGEEGRPIFWTEEYVSGKWQCITNSISADREKAIELHLMVIDKVSISDTAEKTVHWEGLSKEETQMWATLKS